MNSIIAQRYALALFSFAEHENKADKIYSDIQTILFLVSQSAEFERFLNNPTIEQEKRIEIIETIFRKKIDDISMNFLFLLLKKNRLDYLKAICRKFDDIYNEHKRIISVKILSKTALSKQQLSKIAQHLKLKLRKEIQPHLQIDEEMIGGIKLHIEDQVHDFSIKTLLSKFKNNVIYG